MKNFKDFINENIIGISDELNTADNIYNFSNVIFKLDDEILKIILKDSGKKILGNASRFEINSGVIGRDLFSDTKDSGFVFTPRLDDIEKGLPAEEGIVKVDGLIYYKHPIEYKNIIGELSRSGEVDLIKIG